MTLRLSVLSAIVDEIDEPARREHTEWRKTRAGWAAARAQHVLEASDLWYLEAACS